MANIRLTIEYEGSRFHGWQTQPGLRTIEEELKNVLCMVLREEIPSVCASGRTDAGVHAKGQVVNFHAKEDHDLNRLMYAVSGIFRGELSVVAADIVPDNFHATRSAKSKQYSYTIFHRSCPPVLDRGRAWFVNRTLDIERMQKEAGRLIGVHDFTSFRGTRCNATTPVKEIYESELTWNPPYLVYRVVGNGFLKQMVRNIVGTLVDIGRNRGPSISEILRAKDRRIAGVTAPPYGLCLDWVRY